MTPPTPTRRPINLLERVDRFDITNAAGDVFMRRFKLVKTRWFNVYLHQILRSDEDLCLHDHPWRFATLILSGGYREVLPGGIRHRPPGTLLFRPARFRHRIECERTAWSLVIVGRNGLGPGGIEIRCVTRGTKYGNPYKPGTTLYVPGEGQVLIRDKAHAVECYRRNVLDQAAAVLFRWTAAEELAGKHLACWCRLCERHRAGKPVGVTCPDCEPCHADFLLAVANPELVKA